MFKARLFMKPLHIMEQRKKVLQKQHRASKEDQRKSEAKRTPTDNCKLKSSGRDAKEKRQIVNIQRLLS